jgi:hypothetical protein
LTEATDTWSAARQPRQGARTPATKPADEADRIDNIVVKICGIEEQYREIVVQIEADIAAVVNHDSHFACWPAPSKGRRAIPARQSRAASCYTTASSAAALGHLGAVHKRGSGSKNGAVARSVPVR